MPNRSQAHQILLLPENRSADRALQNTLRDLKQRKPKLIYLHGPTGVGKSHLITQALRIISKLSRSLNYRSVVASEFAAELADASVDKNIRQFQEVYRDLDLLIFEDLQSIAKRKETQRQLVVMIDELHSQGAVVILSANSLPGGLTGLNRRLIDRCRGGLSLEITLPSQKAVFDCANTSLNNFMNLSPNRSWNYLRSRYGINTRFIGDS